MSSSNLAESRTGYWQEFGERWNEFWFAPADPLPLGIIRVFVGLCWLLYLVILTPDLAAWFSAGGLVPRDLFQRLVLDGGGVNEFAYWSIFSQLGSPGAVFGVHVVFMVVAVLLVIGCFSRAAAAVSLFALLQYVHRAPFVTAQAEPVLAFMLLYLFIGPCGATLSLDAWRRRKPGSSLLAAEPRWDARVALRLMQVHLAAFYLMMAVSKLHGDVWWRGEAIWAMMALVHSRLFDWSAFRDHPYLINFWTHAIVLFELTFAALIWPRMTRPLVLAVGIIIWLSLLPLSGAIVFCLLMIVANAAFVPGEWWQRWLGRFSAAQA
jgi:hypothetical protein